jgi:hypothetical protein
MLKHPLPPFGVLPHAFGARENAFSLKRSLGEYGEAGRGCFNK